MRSGQWERGIVAVDVCSFRNASFGRYLFICDKNAVDVDEGGSDSGMIARRLHAKCMSVDSRLSKERICSRGDFTLDLSDCMFMFCLEFSWDQGGAGVCGVGWHHVLTRARGAATISKMWLWAVAWYKAKHQYFHCFIYIIPDHESYHIRHTRIPPWHFDRIRYMDVPRLVSTRFGVTGSPVIVGVFIFLLILNARGGDPSLQP